MLDFFRAYRADGTTVPTYFIESTAPDNVDDTAVDQQKKLPNLTPVDSDDAVNAIAKALAEHDNPNLVVMVHGFNNPGPAVLKTYTDAAIAIAADAEITRRKGLVCIGYRWPSEKMGQPWGGMWAALPTLPTWILFIGIFLSVMPFLLFYGWPALHLPAEINLTINFDWPFSFHRQFNLLSFFQSVRADHIGTMAGLTFAGLVLTAVLLRLIVYFRDNYRATNYGVPDLVQVIRAIDSAIIKLRHGDTAQANVQLSFIGHSMGGFVVTNTIRVLSNVFEVPVTALNAFGAGSTVADKPPPPSPRIGHVFQLKRFVLASPDIPAETLLSSRSNFLASALSRFEEAYLFSNEGDEVLRQISTLANYFMFPTKNRRHGFRLGNVEILKSEYGLVDVKDDDILGTLRIGNLTLQELYASLEKAKAERHAHAHVTPEQAELPKVFTYFDCTDYVDKDNSNKVRPLLTFAKCLKRKNPDAKLGRLSHLHLLWAYLVHGQRPNVHGGYFEGALSQQLIYRLACLGYAETVKVYGSVAALSQVCKDKQIRGLLSPHLAMPRLMTPMPAVHLEAAYRALPRLEERS